MLSHVVIIASQMNDLPFCFHLGRARPFQTDSQCRSGKKAGCGPDVLLLRMLGLRSRVADRLLHFSCRLTHGLAHMVMIDVMLS